jgi:hypothetical protein
VKGKGEGGEQWAGRGVGLGRLGRKGRVLAFVFFLFFFQTPFSNHFSTLNQIKLFLNFSQEFYRLFRDHTSNQKPCKPNDDAHTLVVSKFIKLSLIFLELNFN